MTDTPRTISFLLQSEFEDGQTGRISAQFMRDLIVTTQARSYLSVMQFGAVGDGVTDDAAAIQAALNAAAVTTGVVFFPPAPGGAYAVKSTLTWPFGVFGIGTASLGYFDGYDAYLSQSIPGSSCRIRATGSFSGTDLISFATSNDRGHGYGLCNIVIDANNIAQIGLHVPAGGFFERRLFLDNVAVLRTNTFDCLSANNSLVTARDCHFFASGRYGVSGSPMTDSVFEGCYVHSNTSGGFYFDDGSGPSSIIGGKIEENFGPGITLRQVSSNTALNVYFNLVGVMIQHNTYPGVYCTSISGSGTVLAALTGCVLVDNGYAQTLINGAQLAASGKGRIVADACSFGRGGTSISPYHFGVASSGKLWYRNATVGGTAATSLTYNDASGTITADGGTISSIA